MPDTVKYVDVELVGRMPKLRQEILKLNDGYVRLPKKSIWVSFVSKALSKTGTRPHLTEASGSAHYSVMISNVGGNRGFYDSINLLAKKIQQSGGYALAIAQREVVNTPQAQGIVQQFGRAARLGFLVEENPEDVTVQKISSALDQWLAYWEDTERDPKTDHPPYLLIRERLSDEASGRLDGSKIAKLFGLSTSEMGKICGVSKQSFHANPTSKGIQSRLEPLAQAARGILWCSGDEQRFRAWLNQPNRDFPELDGKQLSPLDLIRMGHAQVVADKVQNLLVGHPA